AHGYLRGLFVGGTLCDEAMLVAAASLGPIRSNIPLSPELRLDTTLTAGAHTMVDFGDDELTSGRAHPMIDPTLRLAHLTRTAADPSTGVVLMDVVLGHGAEADPASSLAPAIRQARETARAAGRELPVVVAVVGTEGDPQQLSRQATALAGAGAEVFLSPAPATRRAVDLTGGAR
ncbi:MAG TPA: acyl-CoA synthetase FdrA, partial [Nocardioidaceae bacterium]